MTRDDWLRALEEVRTAPLPPTKAITLAEFADLIGTTRSGAVPRIRRLVAAGKATVTKKAVRRADGGVILVPAYELVP